MWTGELRFDGVCNFQNTTVYKQQSILYSITMCCRCADHSVVPLTLVNCREWALSTRRRTPLWHEKHLVCKISMHVRMHVCIHARPPACLHTFTRATLKHTHTQTRCVCVCVLCSLHWVVIVLWQCWVLLRTEWRLRRRRGRCWIDTDVCWPWQRCDTPSGSRSAPTHFLSSCPMLIVAWQFTLRDHANCQLIARCLL